MIVALHAATTLLASSLLFCAQPMIARALLPVFGGSSSVWVTCMLFFQLTLLAGYAWAHGGPRWLGPRGHAAAHLVLMVVALRWLPFSLHDGLAGVQGTQAVSSFAASLAPAGLGPAVRLVALLVERAALPVALLSATSPLVQRWLALGAAIGTDGSQPFGTSRRWADPYWLYAASNVGSLGALLAYPLLVEPWLGLRAQGLAWRAGFVALVLSLVVCAAGPLRTARPIGATGDSVPSPLDLRAAWRERLAWAWPAAVASSLLSGVTSHLTTDLASVPMLWVVPLALYLATFVLVFARRPWLPHARVSRALPLPAAVTALLFVSEAEGPAWLLFVVHLATFFLAAMVCHGALVRARPEAARLTEFYLFVAIGGLVGGAFNALVAPMIFAGFAEYPMSLVAACALRDPVRGPDDRVPEGAVSWLVRRLRGPDAALGSTRGPDAALGSTRGPDPAQGWPRIAALLGGPAVLLAGTLALSRVARATVEGAGKTAVVLVFLPPLLLNLRSLERPVRYALGLGAVLLASVGHAGATGEAIFRARSFHGVHRVTIDASGRWRQLVDGATVHGRQAIDPALSRRPCGYYHDEGPVGALLREHRRQPASPLVAVVGLGAGVMAAHARDGDRWWFLELDRQVVDIASDPRLFTFLRDAFEGDRSLTVTVGDARLGLHQAPDGTLGALFLDAFSGDSVPTHLLTREAFELYARKVAPGGLVAVHVSNRYLDLARVVAASSAAARSRGGADEVFCWADGEVSPEQAATGKLASHWCVVVGPDRPALRAAPWARVEASMAAWADDRVSLVDAIAWPPGAR